MSVADEWVKENWGNIRDNVDETLKAAAMLPGAVQAYKQDGGDTFEEVMAKLSTQLYCLDMNLGDNPPGYVPPRPPGHPPNKTAEAAPKNWARSKPVHADTELVRPSLEAATTLLSELIGTADGRLCDAKYLREQLLLVNLHLWRVRWETGVLPQAEVGNEDADLEVARKLHTVLAGGEP